MSIRTICAAAAVALAALLPGAAAAQSLAYSSPGPTNMRAGPGPDFPVIARVVGGSRVSVYGCLRDYSWCDSVVQGYRGWISTTRLEFPYAGRRVGVPQYYANFGAPVIGFDFGYWDDHYRGRSFYRDRGRWDRDWRHGRRDRDYSDRGPPPRDRGPGRGPDRGRDYSDRGPPPFPPEYDGRGPRPGDYDDRGPGRGPDRGDRGPDRRDRDWERGRGDRGRDGRDRGSDYVERGPDRGPDGGRGDGRRGDGGRGDGRLYPRDGEGRGPGRGPGPGDGCVTAAGGVTICP